MIESNSIITTSIFPQYMIADTTATATTGTSGTSVTGQVHYNEYFNEYNNCLVTAFTVSPDISVSSEWVDIPRFLQDPKQRLKEIIRSRQAPRIHSSRKPILAANDVREERARETLRKILGESRFRSFLRSGFITVRGKSGKVYVIRPGHDFTRVFQNGKEVEQLCVILSGNFPPTDSLVMRYLLILNDEKEFRKMANRWDASGSRSKVVVPESRSLVEIFRELKAA